MITAFAVTLVIGFGLGYAVAWNVAKHPGKIASQAQRLEDEINRKLRGE